MILETSDFNEYLLEQYDEFVNLIKINHGEPLGKQRNHKDYMALVLAD